MVDIRPVGYVIGMLVAALGGTMLIPLVLDVFLRNGNWSAFLESAALTTGCGVLIALSCASGAKDRMSLQQMFLLTTGVWFTLPLFGALPFVFGATEARAVDAVFEAMSGLTTTGSTVFSGLETLPEGLLLWRGLLQWFGGIGIVVVAMVFLPELGVGGMQVFKSEGFDTDGKILPKASQIASQVSVIYLGLTVCCGMAYLWLGMSGLDAAIHAMTTVATGGFANYDTSFGGFSPGIQYVAVVFMLLAALPFVRYVQLVSGAPGRLFHDSQVRVFFGIFAFCVLVIALWQWRRMGFGETPFREALFNTTSILTGTGYASADYMLWGPFPITALFFIGLIGGCAGSTTCSIKVFRYQLLFAAIRAQMRRIHSPNGLFIPRFEGKPVPEAVLSSVMAFLVVFILSLGSLAVLLSMTGLDFTTSVSGSAAALANIGPGLGDQIGPAGNFGGLNDAAKWLLSAGMLLGRLELLAVYTLFTPVFWRV